MLPPGIPYLTSIALVPIRLRLTNYAVIGIVAYALYAFGFTLIESLVLASFWMLLAGYLIIDYLYGIPLPI